MLTIHKFLTLCFQSLNYCQPEAMRLCKLNPFTFDIEVPDDREVCFFIKPDLLGVIPDHKKNGFILKDDGSLVLSISLPSPLTADEASLVEVCGQEMVDTGKAKVRELSRQFAERIAA